MWRFSSVVLLTTTLSSIALAETASTGAPSATTKTASASAVTPAATPPEKESPPAAKPRGVMEPIDDFKPSDLKKLHTKPPVTTSTPATAPLIMPTADAPAPTSPTAPAVTPPPPPAAIDKTTTTLKLSPDEPASFRCFVRDVMAFYDRTQVRCFNPVQGKIAFFAVDTAQPVAGTVITKALAGLRSGKPVQLTFAPTPDLNPPNCAPSACRRLIDIKN